MAPESSPDPQARLFIALDLPDDVRKGVADWQAKALGDSALRPMRQDALHITLCFLASKAEHQIPRIEEVLRSIEPRPVTIQFDSEPSAVPKGRPRLYTLTAQSDDAVALQIDVSKALAAAGLYEPEKRNFWPHVTVARVRSERLAPERGKRRGKARPKRVQKPPGPLPKAFEQAFDAVRVVLYRSHLKPQGAEYIALSGIDLPFPEDQKR